MLCYQLCGHVILVSWRQWHFNMLCDTDDCFLKPINGAQNKIKREELCINTSVSYPTFFLYILHTFASTWITFLNENESQPNSFHEISWTRGHRISIFPLFKPMRRGCFTPETGGPADQHIRLAARECAHISINRHPSQNNIYSGREDRNKAKPSALIIKSSSPSLLSLFESHQNTKISDSFWNSFWWNHCVLTDIDIGNLVNFFMLTCTCIFPEY